jgi:lysophospholipase L1-like esterase
MPVLPSTIFVLFLFLLEKTSSEQASNNAMIKYVALGASDAMGIGTSEPSKDGWVPKFTSLINAQQVFNLGRFGTTISKAMCDQLPQVFDHKPNVITIWLVVNDFIYQVFNPSIFTSYKSDLNKMLSQLRTNLDKDTRILVANLPDLSQISFFTSRGISKQSLTMKIKQWNDAIQDIVRKNQCELVDVYAHWEELALHPEYISLDGFHPSAHGYTKLAEIFYQQYSKN